MTKAVVVAAKGREVVASKGEGALIRQNCSQISTSTICQNNVPVLSEPMHKERLSKKTSPAVEAAEKHVPENVIARSESQPVAFMSPVGSKALCMKRQYFM